jgi:3-methyladenine DNA glycosylase/8-oxoguanine DNA glycosylase
VNVTRPANMAATPEAETTIDTVERIDLAATLAPLAHGNGDPTIRIRADGVWLAMRTPAGPVTMRLVGSGVEVRVSAWGLGAAWALVHAADLVGANDRPQDLVPRHRLIGELMRRMPGLRLPRTHRPFDALLPAICEQKVTGIEARAAYRGIIRVHGEPAPGPARLRLPPLPAVLARLPYFAYHRFGLERRRADLIRRCAQLAPRLEQLPEADLPAALLRVPGIGPWTVAEVTRVAFGDPDAISVGDYHIPNMVAWVLAGEPRADDERMLELLEPYRGQRGRVQRLLELSGLHAPRRGPRMPLRNFAAQ